MRHSSLETINTNITSADEFVWVDNHTRLVELQRVPWSKSTTFSKPLVRIARETQRLSKTLGMCTKQEVSGSLKIVLSPALADSCIKACHRSAAISAVSGDQMKLSKKVPELAFNFQLVGSIGGCVTYGLVLLCINTQPFT
ncbi:hypothetical protein CEXT_653581 [Caerostris extrusa]|uniref:ABTB2/3 histone-like domain-containing protein n=1 Tax=Caerostris extrusa TaxID=172846 RepID=A0AAV4NAF0_CAEEX|nr:hypothetical protein CEXT_653581 [Caerostris extrusa]